MAHLIIGKTVCSLCGRIIASPDGVIAFPAFLPAGHRWSRFSDAAFHQACFSQWDGAKPFSALYEQFRGIWKSVPRTLPALEQEQWLTSKLSEFNRRVLNSGNQ
jgi:hypothetical protein